MVTKLEKRHGFKQKNIYHAGTFTGTASSDGGIPRNGKYNLSLSGTFVATVLLERSFDGGLNFVEVASHTIPVEEVNDVAAGISEVSVIYRLRCSAFTSGTIIWVLHQ